MEAMRPGLSVAEVAALRVAAGSLAPDKVDEFITSVRGAMRTGRPYNDIIELPSGRVIARHMEPLAGRGWVATHEDITERAGRPRRILTWRSTTR